MKNSKKELTEKEKIALFRENIDRLYGELAKKDPQYAAAFAWQAEKAMLKIEGEARANEM